MMNFQAIRNANGQNVLMSAIATRIDGTSFIPSGTPKQNCKFTDANGECQSVTIWQGRGQPIPLEQQGQTLQINISCKQSGNRTNYGGFWNANAQVRPISAQPAQQGQQAPQQGDYRPNTPQQASQDARSVSISIERRAVWKGACNVFMGQGFPATPQKVVALAKAGQYFVETGNNLADVPEMPDEGSQVPPPTNALHNPAPPPAGEHQYEGGYVEGQQQDQGEDNIPF